jgi:hypothetical protein
MTKKIISTTFGKDGNCLVCGINHAYGDKCEIEPVHKVEVKA